MLPNCALYRCPLAGLGSRIDQNHEVSKRRIKIVLLPCPWRGVAGICDQLVLARIGIPPGLPFDAFNGIVFQRGRQQISTKAMADHQKTVRILQPVVIGNRAPILDHVERILD